MPQSQILLIEDSEITQMIVQSSLKDVCEVRSSNSIAQGLNALLTENFALILLDINLPDGDGFEAYLKIREIERFKHTPIIFLTARGEREDKIQGFSLGADDYIVKPFDIIEFRMRISSKLRNLAAAKQSSVSDSLVVGPFQVNVSAQKIALIDENSKPGVMDLTGNQFKILFYLLRNEDKVISREELLKEIWGKNVHISDRTVDTHIYAIRQQLGSHAGYIQSVHGMGYRFNSKATALKKAV